jgi:hypothetical protein
MKILEGYTDEQGKYRLTQELVRKHQTRNYQDLQLAVDRGEIDRQGLVQTINERVQLPKDDPNYLTPDQGRELVNRMVGTQSRSLSRRRVAMKLEDPSTVLENSAEHGTALIEIMQDPAIGAINERRQIVNPAAVAGAIIQTGLSSEGLASLVLANFASDDPTVAMNGARTIGAIGSADAALFATMMRLADDSTKRALHQIVADFEAGHYDNPEQAAAALNRAKLYRAEKPEQARESRLSELIRVGALTKDNIDGALNDLIETVRNAKDADGQALYPNIQRVWYRNDDGIIFANDDFREWLINTWADGYNLARGLTVPAATEEATRHVIREVSRNINFVELDDGIVPVNINWRGGRLARRWWWGPGMKDEAEKDLVKRGYEWSDVRGVRPTQGTVPAQDYTSPDYVDPVEWRMRHQGWLFLDQYGHPITDPNTENPIIWQPGLKQQDQNLSFGDLLASKRFMRDLANKTPSWSENRMILHQDDSDLQKIFDRIQQQPLPPPSTSEPIDTLEQAYKETRRDRE